MTIPICALSILLAPILVNANADVRSLVTKVSKAGREMVLWGNPVAAGLKLPPGALGRAVESDEIESPDGAFHGCFVIIDTHTLQAGSIVFLRRATTGPNSDAYFVHLNLKGQPISSLNVKGKYDDNGRPVKGSAVLSHVPASTLMITTETKFWLKGKGRKKTTAKPDGGKP